jgi:GNAT superfamily N-acetyltransferase
MTTTSKNTVPIYCWEPTELGTPILAAAQQLYESTLDADERIPWRWIEKAVLDRANRRPTGWVKHLLLASTSVEVEDPDALVGFAHGAFLPNYGGYLCYLGVADHARRLGVGGRLMDTMFKVFAADAALAGERLPFVIWESCRPDHDDSRAAQHVWHARLKLFDRVGGLWLEGVELHSPDWADPTKPAVPLQLFVKPMDDTRDSFTSERLVTIVDGLLRQVYHEEPGDELYDASLPPDAAPLLRPCRAAALVPV